jgi:hypothetical protein
MNELQISCLQLENGIKRIVLNYIDANGEPQNKIEDYENLSAGDKAIVDNFETLSNTLMNL